MSVASFLLSTFVKIDRPSELSLHGGETYSYLCLNNESMFSREWISEMLCLVFTILHCISTLHSSKLLAETFRQLECLERVYIMCSIWKELHSLSGMSETSYIRSVFSGVWQLKVEVSLEFSLTFSTRHFFSLHERWTQQYTGFVSSDVIFFTILLSTCMFYYLQFVIVIIELYCCL